MNDKIKLGLKVGGCFIGISLLLFVSFKIAGHLVERGESTSKLVYEAGQEEKDSKEETSKEEKVGYAPLSEDASWMGSEEDTVTGYVDELMSLNPAYSNKEYACVIEDSDDCYVVSVDDYTIYYNKSNLAFRRLTKSSEFTEEEKLWLSPNGDETYFSEENGTFIFE